MDFEKLYEIVSTTTVADSVGIQPCIHKSRWRIKGLRGWLSSVPSLLNATNLRKVSEIIPMPVKHLLASQQRVMSVERILGPIEQLVQFVALSRLRFGFEPRWDYMW